MTPEIWKPITIKPYDYGYSVSSNGRIRKEDYLQRCVSRAGNVHFVKHAGRILKEQRNKYGYCGFASRRKHFLVHRVVAMEFIPNPENKKQVNHINGVKWDNRVENLEWATVQENFNHAKKENLTCFGEKHCRSIVGMDRAKEIKALLDSGIKKSQVARLFKLKYYLIQDIDRGKTWKRA